MSGTSAAAATPSDATISQANGAKRGASARRPGRPKAASASIIKTPSRKAGAASIAKPEADKAPAKSVPPPAAALRSTMAPLIQGLFATFPSEGADIDEAKRWMDTANAVLKQICRFPGTLTVTAA